MGRVRDIDGDRVTLADDLAATTAAADTKMTEILARIDQFVNTNGVAATPTEDFDQTARLAAGTPRCLEL